MTLEQHIAKAPRLDTGEIIIEASFAFLADTEDNLLGYIRIFEDKTEHRFGNNFMGGVADEDTEEEENSPTYYDVSMEGFYYDIPSLKAEMKRMDKKYDWFLLCSSWLLIDGRDIFIDNEWLI